MMQARVTCSKMPCTVAFYNGHAFLGKMLLEKRNSLPTSSWPETLVSQLMSVECLDDRSIQRVRRRPLHTTIISEDRIQWAVKSLTKRREPRRRYQIKKR